MSLQLKSGNRYGMSFANSFCNAHFTICIRQFKATNITAAASTAIEQKIVCSKHSKFELKIIFSIGKSIEVSWLDS